MARVVMVLKAQVWRGKDPDTVIEMNPLRVEIPISLAHTLDPEGRKLARMAMAKAGLVLLKRARLAFKKWDGEGR